MTTDEMRERGEKWLSTPVHDANLFGNLWLIAAELIDALRESRVEASRVEQDRAARAIRLGVEPMP